MTASWLSSVNALLKKCVLNVPPAIIGSAGPVANVPLPVFSMKSMFAPNFPNRLMSVMESLCGAGFALSAMELKQMDDILSPLLIKGQSLHHIAVHHADELMKSERTLYAYINSGLFTAKNIDMPRTVRMRPRKNVSKNLKVDKACRAGRDFSCF